MMRMWAAILAVVQVAGPGLVSIADASSEAGALVRRPTPHVESHRTASCPRVHTDQCALCRYLTGTGAAPDRGETALALRVLTTPVPDGAGSVVTSRLGTLPRPRGPPVSVA